jgi:hypothetical protein
MRLNDAATNGDAVITIRIFGDKRGEQFVWSMDVHDSRGVGHETSGVDDDEKSARACIYAALGPLVEKLEFSPAPFRRDLP